MRKYILQMVPLVLLSSLCLAESDYYLSPQMGLSYQNSNIDFDPVHGATEKKRFQSSAIYNLTLGKKIYDDASLELEIAHASKHKFSKNVSLEHDYKSADGRGIRGAQNHNVNAKLTTTSMFANVNYQFKDYLPVSIVPYVLGGIGYSSNKIGDTILNVTHTSNPDPNSNTLVVPGKKINNFAWQIGAGFLLPITQNLEVNLSYKFRSLGKIETTNKYNTILGTATASAPIFKGTLYTSDVLVGLSINF